MLVGIARVFLWAETVVLECERKRQAKPRLGGSYISKKDPRDLT